MKKLNDVQLSRVLSAHENNDLRRGGSFTDARPAYGCLMQVAMADRHGYVVSVANARWFDAAYEPVMGVDQFLAAMEKAGIA